PAPAEEACKEAEKVIREQFKKEYAKKTAAERVALAEKLLEVGSETKDDRTARYVLFREARTVAAQAGILELTLKAVDDLAPYYIVDLRELKLDAFTLMNKAAGLTKEAARELAEAAMAGASEATAADQFPSAERLLAVAETAARKTG